MKKNFPIFVVSLIALSIGMYFLVGCSGMKSKVTLTEAEMTTGIEFVTDTKEEQSNLLFEEREDGTVWVSGCNDYDATEIVIPSTFEGKNVSGVCDEAFYRKDNLNFLSIPDSVMIIGRGAFLGTNIKTLLIPDSVLEIKNDAFACCENLESIVIGSGLTKLNDGVFSQCTSLYTLNIPENITSIEWETFEYCTSLVSVTLPNSLTSIGLGAFRGCTSLKEMIIPESVTIIERGSFAGCVNLESIAIPFIPICPKKGHSVLGYLFTDSYEYDSCIPESLKKVVLGSGCKLIENEDTFLGCENLENIILPETIEYIAEDAFDNCKNLNFNSYRTGVFSSEENGMYLGSLNNDHLCLVKTTNTQILSCEIAPSCKIIGNAAFKNCFKMEKIIISDTLESIGNNAFENCVSLKNVISPSGTDLGFERFELPDTLRIIGECAFLNCSSLSRVLFPTNLEIIGYEAFKDCVNLTDITITNNAIEIGRSAFEGCVNVEYMNTVFLDCYGAKPKVLSIFTHENEIINISDNDKLEELIISGNATKIGRVYQCENLTTVIMGDNIREIGSFAFSGCKKLTTVTLPADLEIIGTVAFSSTNINTLIIPDKVISIGQSAFSSNNNLSEIYISDSVEEIGESAFDHCYNVKSIYIGKNVKSIGEQAFLSYELQTINVNPENQYFISNSEKNVLIELSNKKLIATGSIKSIPNDIEIIGCAAFAGKKTIVGDIVIPQSVKEIERYAFADCEKITSISIQSGTTIGLQAFAGCSELTKVYLSSAVKKLGINLFFNCSNLHDIYFNGKISEWNSLDKDHWDSDTYKGRYNIHCIDGDVKN